MENTNKEKELWDSFSDDEKKFFYANVLFI